MSNLTIKDLRVAAEKIGASINLDYFNIGKISKGEVGLCYKGHHVWYWFSVYKNSQKQYELMFSHTYSMNTGKKSKSFRKKGWPVYEKIRIALGKAA